MRKLATTVLAALGTLAEGCCHCLSDQQVDAIRRELLSRNRASVEPAIRAAVGRRGATLLPIEGKTVRLPPPCSILDAGVEPDALPEYARHDPGLRCQVEEVSWSPDAPDGEVFHLKDGQGKLWLAVTVSSSDLPYARLARLGSTVFFLKPRMSPRKVGDRTQCECDGMPRPWEPKVGAFVIEDIQSVKIEVVDVPMTEEFVDWHCKTIGA